MLKNTTSYEIILSESVPDSEKCCHVSLKKNDKSMLEWRIELVQKEKQTF